MNLQYVHNYWDNSDLKSKFIEFLIHIHNLDLTLWDEAGLWDNNFRPFSYLDDNRMISHVSVYSMDMKIQGKRTRVAQISSVGTHEDYRLKGLNRSLTEKAVAWAEKEHDFFYLFSDVDAIPFYHKCGFRPIKEYNFSTPVEGRPPLSGIHKLDMKNPEHRQLAFQLVCKRDTVSDICGVYTPKLFMFICLYFLDTCVYHIPELNCLVVYKNNTGIITIYDIVAESIPEFDAIYPYICSEESRTVEFLFMGDKMGLKEINVLPANEDRHTHIMGNFPLENKSFTFPYSAYA
ncbi:MAG: GNAT family N-acetyltransferase [candidate division Zixibacteria bacterium]|nr:GNAT family N-acetyltransferase [candidate division Zixibacteria bacterium]